MEWKRRIASLAHHPLNLCCAQCRLSIDSMLCAEGLFASFCFSPCRCEMSHQLLWTIVNNQFTWGKLCLLWLPSVELQDWREIEASFVSWDRTHKPTTEVLYLCTRRLRMGSPYVQVKETNALRPHRVPTVVVQKQQGRGLHRTNQPTFWNRISSKIHQRSQAGRP